VLVEKPGESTAISFGYPMDLHRGSRDFYALWLANSWLGEHRNSVSHLYQVIREVAGNLLTFREFLVALTLTVIITELSYRFIEMPIRRRQVARWWESLRIRRDPVPRQIAAVTVVATLLVLAFGVLRLGLADVQQSEIAAALDAGQMLQADIAVRFSAAGAEHELSLGNCIRTSRGWTIMERLVWSARR